MKAAVGTQMNMDHNLRSEKPRQETGRHSVAEDMKVLDSGNLYTLRIKHYSSIWELEAEGGSGAQGQRGSRKPYLK